MKIHVEDECIEYEVDTCSLEKCTTERLVEILVDRFIELDINHRDMYGLCLSGDSINNVNYEIMDSQQREIESSVAELKHIVKLLNIEEPFNKKKNKVYATINRLKAADEIQKKYYLNKKKAYE